MRQSFPLVLDEGEKEALLGVSSAAVPLLTTAGGCPRDCSVCASFPLGKAHAGSAAAA